MGPFQCFADDDGNVNVRELSMAFLLVAPGSEDLSTRVNAIFRLTDADGSGFLSKEGKSGGW
jgi:hypothetical protein